MGLASDKKPVILMILDGWGVAPSWGGNAISQARTPNFDKAWRYFPSTTLLASGEAVGMPINSPGNSEAGHLNMGAGHVVHQDISLIDNKIADGTFFTNEVLIGAIKHAKQNGSSLHLMGLLSKTGIHSHIRHLFSLLELIKNQGMTNRVFIHLFSDGRDSDPMSGIEMIEEVDAKIKEIGIGKIASVSGRFYAMDRDNRWGRIARAYNMMVKGEGECYVSPRAAFTEAYSKGVTDEFIEPRSVCNKIQERSNIKDDDAIIMFNFRSDRVRELTRAFLDTEIPEFSDREKLQNLYIASLVIYDDHMLSHQAFTPEKIDNPLAKVWSDKGLRQFHIAETEKYPHVTYFINGGTEKPFPGEDRLMIPSPKNVKTYDYAPKMSAEKVTEMLIKAIRANIYDCFIVNFANADMVGHTGNLGAAVQAVECVDKCVGLVLTEIVKRNGVAYIVGDHGNAEQMVNPHTGDADTEHTTNPVPFIIISGNDEIKRIKLQRNGILASVAPTMLDLMHIPIPHEMRNPSIAIKERV